jgi:hypothetical protein
MNLHGAKLYPNASFAIVSVISHNKMIPITGPFEAFPLFFNCLPNLHEKQVTTMLSVGFCYSHYVAGIRANDFLNDIVGMRCLQVYAYTTNEKLNVSHWWHTQIEQ